jgi:ferredoxin-NADP reductase
LYKEDKIGNNKLIFSNNTKADIILKDEFERMLGKNFINTLTKEKTDEYDNEKIDQNYLGKKVNNFNQYFYICGPDAMVEDIHKDLLALGVKEDKIVIEEF